METCNDRKQGWYSIVRYMPNATTRESVAVGCCVLVDRMEKREIACYSINDYDRAEEFFPGAREYLELFLSGFCDRVTWYHDRHRLDDFIASRANALQMTPLRSCSVSTAKHFAKSILASLNDVSE